MSCPGQTQTGEKQSPPPFMTHRPVDDHLQARPAFAALQAGALRDGQLGCVSMSEQVGRKLKQLVTARVALTVVNHAVFWLEPVHAGSV